MRTSPSKVRREFEAQVLPFLPDLYAVGMRYTRNPDDASDLVQDTVLRAYAAWASFIPGSNCKAWLLRILTNGFINTYRRGRSRKSFAQRSEAEHVTCFFGTEQQERTLSPEHALTQDTLGDEVSEALAELPDDYRVVVVLADLEGMKYKEVADVLGCPIGTVMSRLFRARRQLEERLATFARTDYGIRRAA